MSFFSVSLLASDISLNRKLSINQIKGNGEYTHQILLDLYIGEKDIPLLDNIQKEIQYSQKKLDKCNILIQLNEVRVINFPSWFYEFESVEFNGGAVSKWEKEFYSQVPSKSTGILYVDSLDWTIGNNGTVAVAYGPFLLDLNIVNDQDDRNFIKEKLLGHSVLGKSRGKWTLVHEIGHSILNLTHVNDPQNIMYPYDFGRNADPEFSQEQCEKGKKNAPYVKLIK